MKLTQLTDWHLNQLEKLAKVTAVSYQNEQFEFWSGVSKLGDTQLKPTELGFIVNERYDTHHVSKADEDTLLHYFYIPNENHHYLFDRGL